MSERIDNQRNALRQQTLRTQHCRHLRFQRCDDDDDERRLLNLPTLTPLHSHTALFRTFQPVSPTALFSAFGDHRQASSLPHFAPSSMASTKPVSNLSAASPTNAAPTSSSPPPSDKPSAASSSSAPSADSKDAPRDLKSEVTSDGMRIESNWDEVVTSFDDMSLKDDLLRGIYAYGFEKPSAIQQRGIMPILADHDTIAQAQSGTGKTATFSISVLQQIDQKLKKTQALILAVRHTITLIEAKQ